jgi:hypothetical protein
MRSSECGVHARIKCFLKIETERNIITNDANKANYTNNAGICFMTLGSFVQCV